LCARYYPGLVKAKTTAIAKVVFYKGDYKSYFKNGSIRDKVVLLGLACLVDVVDSRVDKIRAWAQRNELKDTRLVDISSGTKNRDSLEMINAGSRYE
jgi:hypothetical protein